MTSHMTVLYEISRVLERPLSLLHLASSFTQNGGDSLSSMQLQSALRKQHIHLSVGSILAATNLLQLIDESTHNPEHIEDAGPIAAPLQRMEHKRLQALEQPKKPLCRPQHAEAGPGDEKAIERHPMTEMQLSLVQSTRQNPGRNIIAYFETHRPENIAALRIAWEKVLQSEPIFNLVFEVDELHGYMHEAAQVPFVWEEVMVSTASSYEQELGKWLPTEEYIGSSFKVITLQPKGEQGRSTVIWRVHHAMVDGVSFALIHSKIRRILSGQPLVAGPSFLEFSQKLRLIQLKGHKSAVAFWARKQGTSPHAPTRLLLPDRPSDQGTPATLNGQIQINSNVQRLGEYARKKGITLPSLYFAAWGLVVARYADSDSASFGAVLCGRNFPIEGAQSIVGPMMNMLPFHISLDTYITVDEYLRAVFNSLVEIMSFHWSTPNHGYSRNFSSAVNIQCEKSTFEETSFSPIQEPFSQVVSDIPIQVEVARCGRIYLTYNTESFDHVQMGRMSTALSRILDALITPGLSLKACLESPIGPLERAELGSLGNWESILSRRGSTQEDLVSLFERAAEANPQLVAVQDTLRTLTYAELHHQSSVVAGQLLAFVAPGDVVCVHADGSMNWIVAIYAVLKAGATYCPLDQHLPDADRAIKFGAANAKAYLTGQAAPTAKPTWCPVWLSVEQLLVEEWIPAFIRGLPTQKERLGSNAYICFTSGSTGKPKGVICRHEGLVAFQQDFRVRLCARPGWRVAQFMSPGFDGSIHEIFSALCYGATLVLKDALRPFDHLKVCNTAILTPSVAQALDPADFEGLQVVYLVGEAVPQSVCDKWAFQRQLFNMYGPTEATCGATIKPLTAQLPVTLGVPTSSTRIYILDGHKQLVPRGVIGEIYLAGIQVADKYVGQPDETSKKFSLDSINPEYSDEYMYRTGDRGFWNECGELLFLGRADRQVKLRGFRIDLDDLEVRMTKADGQCTTTAVIIKDDSLVAFIQPANLDIQKFKSHIRQHIPVYSLPHHIIAVNSFPTTPTGKLDYKALASEANEEPMPDQISVDSEKKITTALRYVLGISENTDIDCEASFSELGGNSIHAMRLKHRLSRDFEQHVSVSMILESVSIRDLAKAVARLQPTGDNHAGLTLEDHHTSPIESEWWYKYQQNIGTSSFNVSYACKLPQSLDRLRLVSAWNLVLRRHRILRCKYRLSGSRGLIREYFPHPPTTKEVDVMDIKTEVNTTFNVTRGDELIRVLVSSKHMLVVVSHIICDLTTLGILLREVADVYHSNELSPVLKTYFQTVWSVPAAPHNLAFWSQYLDGACQPTPSILNDGKKRKTWNGSSHVFEIDKAAYQGMISFVSANKVTMHQLVIGAVALALQQESEDCDIVVGAPYLNRNSEEDLEVVGLFLEPLPIRVRYSSSDEENGVHSESFGSSTPSLKVKPDPFIRAVQQSSRAALSHAVPWDQLIKHLKLEPDFPNHHIFDTMVTFHEADQSLRFPIRDTQFLHTWADGAKFRLMVEFTSRDDGTVSVRLEYSTECLTREKAQLIGQLVLEALQGLVAGDGYLGTIRRLRALRNNGASDAMMER
ncbi:hypothetical protein PFICI_09663 [Pestalotiopsis fici W106-1]|uniref:Carrier domain-containing protein n=1 Tax=Pestalotiopsis fici (strain W106-1 / CGMCC3.15140) TaxID=1229662 RepID=W3WXI8_PESFW|nr:uncharacterized protein PFICI_09663 [Pestalotiopsis fici W106-1]ETS77601.1 hypothetical protein PFICI_09663 [Pestalotiopsis fici W106-1]